MTAILLFATYFLLAIWIYRPKNAVGIRESFVLAWLVFTAFTALATEFISLFDGIYFLPITICWTSSIAWLAYKCRGYKIKKFLPLTRIKDLDLKEKFAITSTIAIWGLLLFLAIVCPPNTWDSMTYHMARVAHWKQNHNIGFYPTHILRQLHQPPLSEYLILHLQILSDSDRLANIPQFFGMSISILGASLIAKDFGCRRSYQLLTALLAITIPMGIMQSTSTQNDYVLTSMLVSGAYLAIKISREKTPIHILFFPIAIGLSFATKGTGYLFALPLFIFTLFQIKDNWQAIFKICITTTICCAILNTGQYFRNFHLYGNILGPGREGELSYSNDLINAPIIISNVIRNLAIHLNSPVPQVNNLITKGVESVHYFIGITTSDLRSTWGEIPFSLDPLNPHEDGTGNLLHLLLIGMSLLIYLCNKKIEKKLITNYIYFLVSCFLIFSIYLKWQPWHSRLQLPIFILWTPFLAYIISSVKFLRSQLYPIQLILVISCLPWILFSSTKPLLAKLQSKPPFYRTTENILTTSRDFQYFINRPRLFESFTKAVEIIKSSGAKNVGLIIQGDEWEYPIFALLQGTSIHLHNVKVENISKTLNNETIQQDLILDINSKRKVEALDGQMYRKIWGDENLSIHAPFLPPTTH
ncbi:glycosyltransferase family 39 protein [Polynucleobacter sp. AP-Kaivos-20-H2]|uniref:ArnT family glycosyltransferase n=1 Tax=Polynucleobacter sp. AP-Kaivos-20-H2 TaxID=2689104 RepID=UPI001C0D5BFB|nr:glycosyltransferase family 39 protein [Polynucleobacter sp. AP-Kaivos-20-H2]MBU3604124.1 glycosyltransferase family 39 protein [Polynucleobacter sp. AP-Kaivos-20-H2]